MKGLLSVAGRGNCPRGLAECACGSSSSSSGAPARSSLLKSGDSIITAPPVPPTPFSGVLMDADEKGSCVEEDGTGAGAEGEDVVVEWGSIAA